MKIAFVIDNLDVRGGTHKGLLRLCEYTEKQGTDFVILTKNYEKEKTYPEFKKYINRVAAILLFPSVKT